jgi:hypothetical protein
MTKPTFFWVVAGATEGAVTGAFATVLTDGVPESPQAIKPRLRNRAEAQDKVRIYIPLGNLAEKIEH